MSYIALYRKYRPKNFDEVIAQEHIKQTIKNQVKNNRVGHAYLFSGVRGTGKTTIAKILARAVNCLNPHDGNPCNECEMCIEALEGRLTDITEMDAASNNGVDNIRDIREEVEFLPTKAKYRVYIIDEVHMLSTGAFNALLKTLEEPPSHVIFILATTEPQKIPATILSRCQRFDFKKIPLKDIMTGLRSICNANNVTIEDGALRLIANLAEGALRDAISVLDRCISDGDSEITENKIRELTGIPEIEHLTKILECLITYDVEGVIKNTEEIIKEGKDINTFIWELIKLVKDMLVLNICGEMDTYNEEEKAKFKNILNKSSKKRLIELIDGLSSIESSMKWSLEKEMLFETGLIKLCIGKEEDNKNNSDDTSNNSSISINTRLNNENKIASYNEETISDDKNIELKNSILTNLKENGKITMYSKLMDAEIKQVENDLIYIIFDKMLDDFGKKVIQSDENKMALKKAAQNAVGKDISIKYVYTKN